MKQYPELFSSKLGKLPVVYKMELNPAIEPVIRPPRQVPVALRDGVKAELNRMLEMGVISKVTEPTEWVSSMVAAKKKNGAIRICIDPRDLNKALLRPRHPMKTIEQVTANMPSAKVFSVLDAKNGFWQVVLDEESSNLTSNTPHGRFKFNCMPYGITSGSEVFQMAMENMFAGYPCKIIVDDILVWGKTDEHAVKQE